ncbi:MAG: APC family permease [Candidatus Binataceae bacterium]
MPINPTSPHAGSGVPPPRVSTFAPSRRLGLLSLVCVMYLVVSGGPYGLEDAVRFAGPKLAILLCLVVPLTLSLPTALMAAELTALMPLEGGFYFWVKEALGPFAGFAEAYLTVLYTAVDMAIYPVLFAAYLSYVMPMSPLTQIVIGVGLVWLSGLLNLAGVRPVGEASMVLTGALILPFVVLIAIGFGRIVHFQMPTASLFGTDPSGALGAGLTIIIWNFAGWENLSVVSAEIENPRHNYGRAIAIALPIIVAGYVLPLMVSLSGVSGSGGDWQEGWFSHVGYLLGGHVLGGAIAIGGGLMSFAVFEAAMLWASRMPFVLAREGYLPPALREVWAVTSTPRRSIVLCCVVFTLLVPLGFLALVVLDVFFYMAALALEMAALVKLRRSAPDRAGLFTVGGGKLGLALTVALPLLTWLATFGLAISAGDGKRDFIIALLLGATVWPAYTFTRRRWGGPART